MEFGSVSLPRVHRYTVALFNGRQRVRLPISKEEAARRAADIISKIGDLDREDVIDLGCSDGTANTN